MNTLSKCCGAPIDVGEIMSWCKTCGKSVDPNSGEPYIGYEWHKKRNILEFPLNTQ